MYKWIYIFRRQRTSLSPTTQNEEKCLTGRGNCQSFKTMSLRMALCGYKSPGPTPVSRFRVPEYTFIRMSSTSIMLMLLCVLPWSHGLVPSASISYLSHGVVAIWPMCRCPVRCILRIPIAVYMVQYVQVFGLQ